MTNLANKISQLEVYAEKLHTLLEYAPRAFVVEFAGTPKSGKSTAVEAVRHFLYRHGFRVHVLAERASLCPIPMKGHLFFNTWCAASMLSELLANVETETDIILIDRGVFDSLVWLTLQEKRGELTSDEARTIESFLLLDRWIQLIDVAVVMNVSASEALKRESDQRITSKTGSIMNVEVLGAISNAVEEATERYQPNFSAIVKHSTDGSDIMSSNVELMEKLCEYIDLFLNPEILVLPTDIVESLSLNENGGFFNESATNKIYDLLTNHGKFIKRDQAEKQSEFVQIVSCGILTCEHKIFLFHEEGNRSKV